MSFVTAGVRAVDKVLEAELYQHDDDFKQEGIVYVSTRKWRVAI